MRARLLYKKFAHEASELPRELEKRRGGAGSNNSALLFHLTQLSREKADINSRHRGPNIRFVHRRAKDYLTAGFW